MSAPDHIEDVDTPGETKLVELRLRLPADLYRRAAG